MKEERVKEVARIAADEVEFRLKQLESDSDHEVKSLTVVIDFDHISVRGVISRVELKRRVV